MIKDITIGQYHPVDSPVHRLDPRTKLMALIVYVAILLILPTPLWYIPCLMGILLLYWIANVPFSFFLRGLRGIILLIFLILLIRMISTPGHEVCHIGPLSITMEGVVKGIQIATRIFLIVCAASLLTYTSTPKSLADGMEKGLAWMERIHIPIHDMALVAMIAFRFIPLLTEEANTIMDAQTARGVDFEKGNVIRRIQNMMALLVPLFFSVVRRSSDLAMAMESRGYTGEEILSHLHPLIYHRADRVTYFAMFILLIVTIIIRILVT